MKFSKSVIPCIMVSMVVQVLLSQENRYGSAGYAPNYDVFKQNSFISDGNVGYSGDLSFDIPLMTIPGRNGHNFDIKISYSSKITQHQKASWVGLGWNLDIGAVTRNVIGRVDDQEPFPSDSPYNLDDFLGGSVPARAEQAGRLSPLHLDNNSDADQVDAYTMNINGQSMEIAPFPNNTLLNHTNPLDCYSFLPLQWSPIKIVAKRPVNVDENGTRFIYQFVATGEDGTVYDFGGFDFNDFVELRDNTPATDRYYEFPYSWPLQKITYPDGNQIDITYQKLVNPMYKTRKFENIYIDRGQPYDWGFTFNENYFGDGDNLLNKVSYQYSIVKKIETATHYAEFFYTVFDESDLSSTNNCAQLNSIRLYDKPTATELRRVTFQYAAAGLKDDQLTLVSIQIENVGGDEAIPPYVFTYTSNPPIDQHTLATNTIANWPGYYIGSGMGTAWRLGSITLPTGENISYTYSSFNVLYDPEGYDTFTSLTSSPIDYYMEPVSRVTQKQIANLGNTMTYTYEYGDALFNPPSHPTGLNYAPYFVRDYYPLQAEEKYYRYFRGCTIGHRWVKVNNPDGSYKKTYYTSSYKDAETSQDEEEEQPDEFTNTLGTAEGTAVTSHAGRRGLVWKEETSLSTTVNSYSYIALGRFFDRYEYGKSWGGNMTEDYLVQTSIWPKLTQTSVIQDGITKTTTYDYYLTDRESSNENGLIKSISDQGNANTRVTEYKYAMTGPESGPMKEKHMYSQIYSTTVSSYIAGSGAKTGEEKSWTEWELIGESWLPKMESKWNAEKNPSEWAPLYPGTYDLIKTYDSYDAYSNVKQFRDANNIYTTVKWGYNSSLPIATIRNAADNQTLVSVFDDKDASAWSTGAGSWPVPANGMYTQTNGTTIAPWYDPKRNLTASVDDAIIEADVRFEGGTTRYAAVSKFTDANNYVRFEMRRTENQVVIYSVKGGTGVSHGSASFNFSDNQWYHLKGEISGTNAKLYLDGKLMVSADHSNIDISAGYAALHTYNAVASFDNVRFYPINATATSQSYDPVTFQVTQKSDENGSRISLEYDPLQRLKAVRNTKNELLHQFTYSLVGAGLSSSNLNKVIWLQHRNASDKTEVHEYLNGLGYKTQSHTFFGTDDIISATTYDLMGRVDRQYKTYQANTSHLLDLESNVVTNAANYYNNNVYSGITDGSPYERMEYYVDGRLKHQHPAGEIFQAEGNETTGRYLKYSYTSDVSVPSATTQNSGWSYTGTTSIHQALNDGLTPDDATFARMSEQALGFYSNSCTVKLDNASSMLEAPGATFIVTFRARLRLTPEEGSLIVQLLEGTTLKGSLDCTSQLTQNFQNFSFNVSASSITDPSNLFVKITGSEVIATDNRGSGYDVSWVKLDFGMDAYRTAVVDENGAKKTSYKDKLGNTISSVIDAEGLNLATLFEYDILGNLTKSVPPNGELYASSYTYNTRNELTQKTTPDAGTAQYLYDKNGNLRFVKDANHGGTTVGFPTISGTLPTAAVTGGSFTLPIPGRVILINSVVNLGNPSAYITVRIKKNNAVLSQISSSGPSGTSTNIILPKGTYNWEAQTYGLNSTFAYQFVGNQGYEFIYNKYDGLNRLIEQGEHYITSIGSFIQDNANNPSFGSGSVTKQFFYDNPSANPLASGQRNLKGKISYTYSYRLGGLCDESYYSYNDDGRVEWVVKYQLGNYAKKLVYEYDRQGNITKKGYVDAASGKDMYTFYDYDQAGRLWKVHTGPNADGTTGKVQEALYIYFASGKIDQLTLGAAPAQTVAYNYTERDWLSQVSSSKFSMTLGYNAPAPSGMTPTLQQYNGNIGWLTYAMTDVPYTGLFGTTSTVGYTYNYDGANRLLAANFGYNVGGTWQPTDAYAEKNFVYDPQGNISSFKRYAPTGGSELSGSISMATRPEGDDEQRFEAGTIEVGGTGSYIIASGQTDMYAATGSIRLKPGFHAVGNLSAKAFSAGDPVPGEMDNLIYDYQPGTNRLTRIRDDVASGSYSYDIDYQFVNNYAYDGNGNMTQDLGNGIAFAHYDINNLPVMVYKNDGSVQVYSYDVNGNRVRKYATTGGTDTYYLNAPDGKTELVQKGGANSNYTYNIFGNDNLGQITVTTSTANRYYYLKDHLGNIRMTLNSSGTRVGNDDYYPFGMQMDGRSWASSADARYKFTSKERDTYETGYDYFGARYYDSRIARWLAVDPLAEKYPHLSPYNYVANNPTVLFDPNGEDILFSNGTGSPQFVAAYQLYLQSDLGTAQYNRFDSDHDILVIYQVGDLSTSSGESVNGVTNWVHNSAAAEITEIDRSGIGLPNNSVSNDKKIVITITLDAKSFSKNGEVKNAETIYHEGKAHIEYARDKTGTSSGLTTEEEHKRYNAESRGKFLKQAKKKEKERKKKETEQKKKEESRKRVRDAVESRWIDVSRQN